MISIIVAMAHNNVIGNSNDLPWYLPADLKHFKELTTGKTVIMGRKTYDSIYNRLKRPLPNRSNIVITRNQHFKPEHVTVCHSLEDALAAAESEKQFIIGGAQIYEQSLMLANELIVTEVHADIMGDTYFPIINKTLWKEATRESYKKDEKNEYDYSFVTYRRV